MKPRTCNFFPKHSHNIVLRSTVMPELGEPLLPPPIFGRPVNPISTGRADYPHILLLAPQYFSPSGITEIGNHLSEFFLKVLKLTPSSARDGGSGWAGWMYAHPDFGRIEGAAR